MSLLRNSASRRPLSYLFLVCVLACCVWGGARVSANRVTKPISGQQTDAQPSLGTLLKPDGTLDLSRGFNGSLNPQGFRMDYAANGAPRFVPAAPTVGEVWDTQFVNANGAHTFGYAVAVIGTDVYVGGSPLETAGNAIAKGVAKWNGSTWSALGSGVDGSVYALAVSGTDLYVAGDFSTAGGISANDVAKWNGSAWSALGSGVDGLVFALAVSGSDVYVGGTFSMAGGNAAANIAKWNGSAWSALGSGTDQQVVAIAISGSNVYAGGEFSMAGGNPANYVARWNGSAWSALGSGVDFTVNALAVSGSDLYVGGSFSTAGGNPANSIARWNGSSWSALGSGITSSTSAVVRSIVVVGSNVYAGGEFETAGGNPVTNAARWNGSAWSALGNGLASGRTSSNNIAILSLAASGSDLYAAGGFTKSGNTEINGIARWNGTTWSPLGSTSNSVNYNVYAVAVSGNDVYVGGEFDFAGGLPANNIAKWNGSAWSALGSGVNRVVRALAVSGTDLYAGGEFNTAGGAPASYIARWNGSAWSALGSGMTNGVGVYALAISGANLYAGGLFFTAGGNPASNIARWNGSAWSALGSGTSSEVNALAISGSDLYAGGGFTSPASKVAKWNGSSWSALGTGITSNPGVVHALAVSGTDVYAGGFFGAAGGNPIIGLAKWNGSAWSQLGSGLNGYVFSLLSSGSDLYVGGNFDQAGGTAVSGLAKWNGSAWSGLGASTGTNGFPRSFGLQGTSLFVGGTFTALSGTVSHYFGRYGCVSSLTVNNTGDDPDATPGDGLCETVTGNGVCTLRAAIAEANALAGCSAMTIHFSVTGTINAASALPTITHKSLTIAGPGADQLTVDGLDRTHQIFQAGGANVMLQISGLTITRGGISAGGNASAIEFNSSGGQLTVNGCALINNGGFRQMYSNLSGGITINNSTISGNPTGLGILTDRTPLMFINSTITGNNSGAIASAPGNVTVTLLNSTVTDSIGLSGGTSGSVTLKNSIINSIAVSSGVSLISQGNNLCSNATLTPTATGDLINTNPMLSALGNYGGPTPTLALLPGSPAINAGNNTGAPATDQRGIARPQQGTTDIGAFESRGFTMAISGGNNQTGAINNYFPQPLSFTLSSANGEPANGGLVSFTAPASGASATIYNVPAVITGGVMSRIAAANGIFGGPYNVTASANGANTINFQLTNSGPVISSMVVLRTAGAGASNSAIAQVSDPNQAADTLSITVNGAASATSNGVTVSGLSIGAGGQVTANVEAAAGATNAQFTLRATNTQNAVAAAELLVIVTPPVCDGATTWNSPGRINSENASNDYVGFSVALSGDTALIGAFQDDTAGGTNAGSAYVFTRNGATWTLQQQLTASDGENNDLFGISVALSGDTALIGAFGKNSAAGSAYVFTRAGGVWSQQQKLTASDGAGGDGFGVSVALSGDTALIGAYQDDTAGGTNAGSAYVFAHVGDVWIEAQKLTAPNGMLNDMIDDKFGSSVALSGDTALVGATLADTAGGLNAGSAYVFTRNGAIWTLQQQLTASDGASGDDFGVSVTLSGDTALIGAYGGNSGLGAAYVFTRAGGVWSQQQKLTASDGQFGDRFGVSVALSGDTALIGADQTSRPSPGSAYIFTRAGSVWSQQQKLLAPDGLNFDNFGISAALSGTTLIVGAPFDDTAGGTNAGSVYIFTSNCNARPTIAAQTGVARRQGSPISNSVIATVSDAETAAGSLTVTVTSANPSNGVMISNIVNTNGMITADIIADCTATNAGFSLQVDDGASTASVTFNVAVTPNTEPAVNYVNVSVSAGNSTSNAPTAATDNGSITGYVVQSQGTYTGAISVDASGVVSISNAAPVGSHTITIRATDNCGATTDAQFTLTINNNAPTITASAALTRQQASAGIVSTIASVSDGETPVGNLIVTATTVPAGITVTSIVNAGGTITATVAADCTATIGANTVVLTVTDSNNGTATANLTVNVTANAAPSLSYPVSGVALNSATTINPTTATDNGSITGYQIVSVTPPLTVAPTVNSSGVVSVTDAGPFGLHTVTVRATDNCGATTEASFTLNVGCGSLTVNPATLINGLTFVPYSSTLSASGGSGAYTFTLVSGTLPAGLSLGGDTISGTPNTAGASTFTIRATDDNGCFGERSYTLLIGSTGLMYYPLARPVRLLDTRPGASANACFQPNAPIPGGTVRTQPARGTCEGLTIPPSATTITGNITTVQSGGGFLAIYPSDAPPPLVANSNYMPNEIVNNSFTVGVGAADGAVNISVTTDTDVVVDVTGYYAPPTTGGLYFHPLPRPVRLLETRAGFTGCFAPATPLPGSVNTTQQGTGSCQGLTIPAEALALVGNATTVDPSALGYLTLYPADAAQPLVASSNYGAGQTVNGPFTVGLSPSGQFKIFPQWTTDLVIDITGYYSAQANDANGQGLLYSSLGSPLRLLDTRAGQQGCYTPGAAMTGGVVYTQETQSPCTNLTPTARALIGNATVVNTADIGYLTFWPGDAQQPLVATSNYVAGQVINRYFTVGLGPDGSFKRFASSTTNLVVDISGFFAP